MPAAVSAPLAAATAARRRRADHDDDLGVGDELLGDDDAPRRPFSTGVSPCTSCTLRPYFLASVFTAVLRPRELLLADEARRRR